MKIGSFEIRRHKHKWEDKVLAEYKNVHGGYSVKVGKVCVAPACGVGAYKVVVYLDCKNKPEVYNIDIVNPHS